jgi:hypothetical protein
MMDKEQLMVRALLRWAYPDIDYRRVRLCKTNTRNAIAIPKIAPNGGIYTQYVYLQKFMYYSLKQVAKVFLGQDRAENTVYYSSLKYRKAVPDDWWVQGKKYVLELEEDV